MKTNFGLYDSGFILNFTMDKVADAECFHSITLTLKLPVQSISLPCDYKYANGFM